MPYDVTLGERLEAALDKPLEYTRELAGSIQDIQKDVSALSGGSGGKNQDQGFIEVPIDKSYTIDLSPSAALVIATLTLQTLSGTCSVTINIDGVPVTGLTSVAASSTTAVYTATAAKDVAIGKPITLVVSGAGAGSPADLAFTLAYE